MIPHRTAALHKAELNLGCTEQLGIGMQWKTIRCVWECLTHLGKKSLRFELLTLKKDWVTQRRLQDTSSPCRREIIATAGKNWATSLGTDTACMCTAGPGWGSYSLMTHSLWGSCTDLATSGSSFFGGSVLEPCRWAEEGAQLLHVGPQGWGAALPWAQSTPWVVLPAWSTAYMPRSHRSCCVSKPSDGGRTAGGSTQLELGLNLSFPFSCNPHLIFTKQWWSCSSCVLC